MVAKEHPEVMEGRRRLISLGFLDSEDAADYSSIDNYGDALNEEDGSGFVGAGVTEEVEYMQMSLKPSSL